MVYRFSPDSRLESHLDDPGGVLLECMDRKYHWHRYGDATVPGRIED